MKRTTPYASAWSRYSGSGCAVMTTTLAAGFLTLMSAMKSIPEPSGRFTSRTKKSISYSSRSIRASAKERAVRMSSSGMATCSVLANATAVTRSSSNSITQNLFIAKGGRRFLSVTPRVNPNPPGPSPYASLIQGTPQYPPRHQRARRKNACVLVSGKVTTYWSP